MRGIYTANEIRAGLGLPLLEKIMTDDLKNGGWEPIETAPFDKPILVYIPATDMEGNQFWSWSAIVSKGEYEEDENWVSVADWGEGRIGYSVNSAKPTHWMPMPEPPTTTY